MKRIFVSHSTRPDEPEAARYLDAIAEAIQRQNHIFELKIDRLCLAPGVDWRDELYNWMDQADGAVAIIGRNSLKSNFVSIELSFLSIRASLEKEFPLIPVLLPGVEPQHVTVGVSGELDLKRLQFVAEATADAAAETVVTRL